MSRRRVIVGGASKAPPHKKRKRRAASNGGRPGIWRRSRALLGPGPTMRQHMAVMGEGWSLLKANPAVPSFVVGVVAVTVVSSWLHKAPGVAALAGQVGCMAVAVVCLWRLGLFVGVRQEVDDARRALQVGDSRWGRTRLGRAVLVPVACWCLRVGRGTGDPGGEG